MRANGERVSVLLCVIVENNIDALKGKSSSDQLVICCGR